jgi:hypothetical protein
VLTCGQELESSVLLLVRKYLLLFTIATTTSTTAIAITAATIATAVDLASCTGIIITTIGMAVDSTAVTADVTRYCSA